MVNWEWVGEMNEDWTPWQSSRWVCARSLPCWLLVWAKVILSAAVTLKNDERHSHLIRPSLWCVWVWVCAQEGLLLQLTLSAQLSYKPHQHHMNTLADTFYIIHLADGNETITISIIIISEHYTLHILCFRQQSNQQLNRLLCSFKREIS